MLKYIFDLSYDRNLDEAKVFYFCYVIFAFFIAGLFYSSANFFYYLSGFFSGDISTVLTFYVPFLTFFVPFFFYTFLSISIIFKKKLKDRRSLYLVIYTILITFIIPLVLGICFGFGFLDYTKGFRYGIAGTFIDFFFPSLIFGCIPSAILATKEDCSLIKQVQEMEKERLQQELKIEKLLLIERAITNRVTETKNHEDNTEKKEDPNEKE